jgi:hypothetical protein
MNMKTTELTDLVSDLVLTATLGESPSDGLLRKAAEAIDQAVVSPVQFLRFDNLVTRSRATWQRNHQGTSGPVPLGGIADEDLATLAEQPLSQRSDTELRTLRVDRLALDTVALEELRESVMEDMPEPWLELVLEHGERAWRAKGLLAPDPADFLKSHGIDLDVERTPSKAGDAAYREQLATRSADERSAQDEAASGNTPPLAPIAAEVFRPVPGFPKQFLASDKALKWTRPLPNGFPEVLLLEVTTKGKELVVRTGGFGFVEEGCELTVTWLDLLEHQNAEPVTIRDEDASVRFVGREHYDAGQYLVVEFRRLGEAPYAFKAKLEI